MKLKILISTILFLVSFESFAYQKEIDKFFKLYEEGKIVEAVDSIYSTNKWMGNKSDEIQNVKTQMQNLQTLVGEYHGKVKLGEESLEDRLTYISYLTMFERQPVRLEFVFYRPKDKWIIYSYSFDDNIDEELIDFSRKKIVGRMKGS
jgi:soluble cytochrome b562